MTVDTKQLSNLHCQNHFPREKGPELFSVSKQNVKILHAEQIQHFVCKKSEEQSTGFWHIEIDNEDIQENISTMNFFLLCVFK